MKRILWGNLSLLVLSVCLLLTSCSKGKDGATGPAGTTGPAGPTGTTGSANVVYSAWLDVSYSRVTTPDPVNPSVTDTLGQATIPAPKLVDSILQKGTVIVYMNLGTTTSPDILALPCSYPIYGFWVTVDVTTQKIVLTSNFNLSTVTQSGAKSLQYRYVLIPGGVSGRSAIDWKNYSQVKQLLGLTD
jgi:hypothetical protein